MNICSQCEFGEVEFPIKPGEIEDCGYAMSRMFKNMIPVDLPFVKKVQIAPFRCAFLYLWY